MTRIAFATLFVVVAFAIAQPPARPPAPKPWANKLFLPDILKDPGREAPAYVAHDFGSVPAGTVSTHTFTFTNIYDVPLQVVDVRLECGCLKAFPPNRVLKPNESAEFTVAMNAAQFKGAVTKKMLVTVGPSFVSTAELRFSAISREDVSLSAPGLIDFGFVPQGRAAEKSVTLRYTGKVKDWKVEPANAPGGAFTLNVKETSRGEVLGTTYTVTVGLKDTAPPGTLSDAVVLKTNDPDTPSVSVAITGRVQPPVRVAGEGVVVFQDVAPGRAQVGKVLVLADAKCKLTAAADQGDGVTLELFPVAADRHFVTVRYEPKPGAGPLRKEVRLQTDLPGQPEVNFIVEVR
ncbi:MAG: DUF1573 domain-containing protein [Fimbriiglobus sp.]|nr:DUF1573 domain-containing protein [Fimbriiglobus sp.]